MTTATDEIYRAIQELRASHENPRGSHEQQWLQHHLANENLQETVTGLSLVALHILSALEDAPLTGIEIAQKIRVTRGGVTRAAQKLLEYDLVRANKRPEDQKKIYYSLTAQGRQVAAAHDEMHESIRTNIEAALLKKYSSQDLRIVASFLRDLQQLEEQFGRGQNSK